MRIIKGDIRSAAKAVACEMINIETGKRIYVGCEPVQSPEAGYPAICDGNEKYEISAAAGCVYVSPEVDIEVFMEKVEAELMKIDNPQGPQNHLRRYHTEVYGPRINIMSATSQVKSVLYTSDEKACSRPENLRRALVRTTRANTVCRFLWVFECITEFPFEITSVNIAQATAAYACSVFYDSANSCVLEHDEVTFEFSQKLARKYDNLIHEEVKLMIGGLTLLPELSLNYSRALYRITKSIYWHDYSTLKLVPVQVEGEHKSTEVCSRCRETLWGDNYVVVTLDVIKHSKTDRPPPSYAYCPMCLHANPGILEDALCVLRVSFPKTFEDLVASLPISDKRKELFLAIKNAGDTIWGHDSSYPVGDDYLGIRNVETYLFSAMRETTKKKVFVVRSVW